MEQLTLTRENIVAIFTEWRKREKETPEEYGPGEPARIADYFIELAQELKSEANNANL